jgi:tellurite resistance protein
VITTEQWWGNLRISVRTIRAQLAARRAELANADFRDAAVAMCALVAAADGVIDERERDAMVTAMADDDVLGQFDPIVLAQGFDIHVAQLRGAPDSGRRYIRRQIMKLRNRPVQARALVRLGAVIGRADGVFDPGEQKTVVDAARMLGVEGWTLTVQAPGWSRAAPYPGEDDNGGEDYDSDEDTSHGRYPV